MHDVTSTDNHPDRVARPCTPARPAAGGPAAAVVEPLEGRTFFDATAAAAAASSPGERDPSFGRGGAVVVGVPIDGYATARTLTVVGDRAVVGGRAARGRPGEGATPVTAPALVRFTSAGRPDPAFGDAGRFLARPDGRLGTDVLAAVADGRGGLVAAVVLFDPVNESLQQLALLRLGPDGSPDPSFGAGGVARADDLRLDVYATVAPALAAGPGGELYLAAGDTYAGPGGLARFTADGRRDAAFGGSGRIDGVTAVAVGHDGRVTVAGPSGAL